MAVEQIDGGDDLHGGAVGAVVVTHPRWLASTAIKAHRRPRRTPAMALVPFDSGAGSLGSADSPAACLALLVSLVALPAAAVDSSSPPSALTEPAHCRQLSARPGPHPRRAGDQRGLSSVVGRMPARMQPSAPG